MSKPNSPSRKSPGKKPSRGKSPILKPRERAAAAGKRSAPAAATFPVVAIGASAGGLEALDLFVRNVPANSGMAFVVVQHMDPTHKGMLVELLGRTTAMPVLQIKDLMKVERGHVYVIPPNRDLSILNGVLHLLEPATPRGLRLPIDYFFRSLADDQHERAVGVILSGMGSDGTLGIRAIKEKAGAVFVQAPASAKFDGMPRSAIDSGLADVIAPAEDLAGKIVGYLNHAPLLARPMVDLAHDEQGALEKVIILLRAQTGHDFSLYKKASIYRRIERRMGLHRLGRIADYVRYLRENPIEAELLFKDLLIGVTSFFRDPAAWDQLRDQALPALLEARKNEPVLRAWTVGCSTGEEAYSLAMVFKEVAAKRSGRVPPLQIFATDLDKDAIERARQGVYPPNIAADLSEQRLARFFVQEESGFRVSKEIREMVIFANQNLVMDPPFTKLDVLTCRNLLIYLDAELQKKLMPLFHYSLNQGGILMLGSSETVGKTDIFVPLPGSSNKTRLYQRVDNGLGLRPSELVEFPAAFRQLARGNTGPQPRPRGPNLQSIADRLILQRYAPAAVLTGQKGDILYVSGRTGKYLEPAAGQANWNLFAMARPGLRHALTRAFNEAVKLRTSVTVKGAKVPTNGETQIVDITAHPLTESEAMGGAVLIVFTNAATPKRERAPDKSARGAESKRTARTDQELQHAQEELQTTREEMQTSQEELTSANEEMQSTNEELQSTNEELTTSKEEMQSMNEELQTVNHELQAKVDQLSRASSDIKNLLDGTDIATVFLDDALCVRRFTTKAASIIKLIPSDAGRPITDIVSKLDYPELVSDVQEVLRTLAFKERSVASQDGRSFTVRVMPYRTLENRIDGVVITLVDITAAKKLEAELRATEAKLRENLQTARASGKVS